MPVVAEHGYLCERCLTRLRNVLEGLPDLVAHVRSGMIPMPSQVYDRDIVTGGGSSFAQPPMNVEAVDACDYVLWLCRGWATDQGDEFPYGDMSHLVPAGATPEQVASLVRWPSSYLASVLPEIANRERVKAFAADFLDWPTDHSEWSIRKVQSRWPRDSRSHWSNKPCGECGRKSVKCTPPMVEGGPYRVLCKGCGWYPRSTDQAEIYYGGGK